MTLQTGVSYSTAPPKRKRGINSRRSFYTPIMPSNLDGTINSDCDTLEGAFRSLAGAGRYALEIVDEHGGEFIIYEAVPVARVTARGIKELPNGKYAFHSAARTLGGPAPRRG